MALLHALISFKEVFKLKIYVAHLNHLVRGDEAERDLQFVKEYAESKGLVFFEKRKSMEAYGKELGIGAEEAGRRLRYEFFEEVKKTTNSNLIAVAHNKTDQAETLLFRIMRGTGVNGLRGMEFKRGHIIRPLLNISRLEIEEYIKKFNIPFVEDSTNSETDYTRNKIRLELMPYIAENFNSNIEDALYRLSINAKEQKEISNILMEDIFPRVITLTENGLVLRGEEYSELPLSIRRNILRILLDDIKTNFEYGYNSIVNLDKFIIDSSSGKSKDIGGGLVATRLFDNIVFDYSETKDYEINVEIGKEYYIGPVKGYLKFEKKSDLSIEKGVYKKSFDLDKIKGKLIIRNRREGDRIYPYGMDGSKSIKKLMIDEKIPRDKRSSIPIVVAGDELVWVVGLRDSRLFSIDENTKNVLEIIYLSEE